MLILYKQEIRKEFMQKRKDSDRLQRGRDMAEHTETQVVIDGKVLTLYGYESSEHMQKVAAYINDTILEFKKMDSFKRLNQDSRNHLIELNIADDYFKAKKQVELLQQELKTKQEELYNLKHDIINKDIEIETTKEALKKMEQEINENHQKILKLESEIKDKRKA